MFLWIIALLGGLYGLGLLIAPQPLTGFWPWRVDAFHARMYANAFITPAVSAWILSFRRRSAIEHLSFGLNLIAGGFLPLLGTLWTNSYVPVERQVNFSSPGVWMFFSLFFLLGIFGIVLVTSATQLPKSTSLERSRLQV